MCKEEGRAGGVGRERGRREGSTQQALSDS